MRIQSGIDHRCPFYAESTPTHRRGYALGKHLRVAAGMFVLWLGFGMEPLLGESMVRDQHLLLIDFSSRGAAEKWRVVNDGVMGGLSTSRMESTPGGMAVFRGELSLENNGGFASVRTALNEADLSGYDGIVLRVRGDGRSYQLRFRTDERFDGPTYRSVFATKPGEWLEVRIPFSDFQPTYRGRILRGMGPLNTAHLHQLALMVADKKDGPFRLEIAWIKAFSS